VTKPRPIVLAIITMILALAGATAAYAAPLGARGASAEPTVNLAASSRGCGVVHVALHGTKAPTITCLSRTRPANPAGHTGRANVIPGTSPADCPGANLILYSLSEEVCFTGSGYTGLNPDVYYGYEVTAASNSWLRIYYNGPGTYFNMPGSWQQEWFLGPGSLIENVTITQVCDGCGYHS
jgi:hypothetical protein